MTALIPRHPRGLDAVARAAIDEAAARDLVRRARICDRRGLLTTAARWRAKAHAHSRRAARLARASRSEAMP